MQSQSFHIKYRIHIDIGKPKKLLTLHFIKYHMRGWLCDSELNALKKLQIYLFILSCLQLYITQ